MACQRSGVAQFQDITMTNQSDILIVGAGILGLSHAYAAARRGLRVKVFERSATPLGASVRNFGQALVTGQPPGQMLELAKASRPIWAQWAQQANFQLKRNGSILFARTEEEEALLKAFCAGRAVEYDYHVELLQGAALNDLYGGQFRHHRAALCGLDDQQLYSREAIPALIRYLQKELAVEFHFSTLVREVEPGRVVSTAGSFTGKQVVVCSGHDYLTLLAESLAQLAPQICRLQMLRARPEFALDLQHALLTGLSCVHYGAFADLPEAKALQAQIQAQSPHLQTHGIHLLISPTPHGDLIIGDSHDYGQDASPFNAEQVDEWMIALAEQTLGGRIKVVERWQGVYGARGPGPFSLLQVAPGLSAALMHTGVGMSVGPALAERHIARLLGETDQQ
nr:TIGR03364 family FAD-dependent oxidoreductase [Pseudomonas akapageensis]